MYAFVTLIEFVSDSIFFSPTKDARSSRTTRKRERETCLFVRQLKDQNKHSDATTASGKTDDLTYSCQHDSNYSLLPFPTTCAFQSSDSAQLDFQAQKNGDSMRSQRIVPFLQEISQRNTLLQAKTLKQI